MEVKEIVAKLRELADLIEEPETTEIDKEDVRIIMARKSSEGKRLEVRKLINSYGVSHLSDVPDEKLPELFKKVEAL